MKNFVLRSATADEIAAAPAAPPIADEPCDECSAAPDEFAELDRLKATRLQLIASGQLDPSYTHEWVTMLPCKTCGHKRVRYTGYGKGPLGNESTRATFSNEDTRWI